MRKPCALRALRAFVLPATAGVAVAFLEVRDEGLTVGADEEPTSSDGDPGQLALQVLQAQAESKHFRSVAACGGASRRQEYFFC